MRIVKDKKLLFISIAVGIVEIILLYFTFNYNYNSNAFTSPGSITWHNVFGKLGSDCIAMLTVPAVLLISYRKNISLFKLNFKCKWEILILSAIMVLLFLLHNDFGINGFYQLFSYFVVVSFAEEFIYRGFVYNILKGSSRVLAIITSGLFWGITHEVLTSIINNVGIVEMLHSMTSHIAGGIIIGVYFIYLLEKSGTLWIPILVHSILDYSVGPVGIITAFGIFLYLMLKSKKKDKSIQAVKTDEPLM